MQVTKRQRGRNREKRDATGTAARCRQHPSGILLGLVEEPHLKSTASLAAFTLLASLAVAQAPPPLVVQNAWVRATPGADMAAAYLTLRNVSPNAVTVTGIESPIAG